MKKIILLAASIVAFLATACQKEEIYNENPVSDKVDINASIIPMISDQPSSKANVDRNTGKITFEDGDQISVYITPENKKTTLLNMKFNGSDWTKMDGQPLTWNEIGAEKATFTTFYPVINTTPGEPYKHLMDPNPMMNVPGEAKEHDLLMATTEATTQTGVRLNFKHAMALVELNLKSKKGFTPEVLNKASIYMKVDNAVLISTIDGSYGEFQKHDHSYPLKNVGSAKFQAFVCPQNLKPSWKTELFKITVGSNTISYKAPSILSNGSPFDELKAGHKLTFNITINDENGEEIESNEIMWVAGIDAAAIPDESQWGYSFIAPSANVHNILALKWEPQYGWFDVKKCNPTDEYGDPNIDDPFPNDDARMCWAGSASNLIHWWLEQNADNLERYGYTGPRKYGHPFDSEVFNHFKHHFRDQGGSSPNGVSHFLSGRGNPGAGIQRPHDGYFKDVFEGVQMIEYTDKVPVGGGGKVIFVGSIYNVGAYLKHALLTDRHYTIGFSTRQNGYNHAMNIWGAKFDSKGNPSYVYYVDNNNKEYENQGGGIMRPGKLSPCGIMKAAIKCDEAGRWLINGAGSNWIEIGEIVLVHDSKAIWDKYFQTHPNGPVK